VDALFTVLCSLLSVLFHGEYRDCQECNYPWRCLCFAFSQITLTTPRRVMTLHLTQIFLTDARTFICCYPSFKLSAISRQLSALFLQLLNHSTSIRQADSC
jgi:hypothetical protein